MCIRDRIMTERATMGNQGATPTAYYASAPAVVASVPAAGVPTIIPVSYTHLDVYKRQGIYCAAG